MFMLKFCRNNRGSISIFLLLIMLPMFVFGGVVVDYARLNTAKVAVTGAGDLALNGAMTQYDQVLKQVYGIFAMSTTPEELQENLKQHFDNTITNDAALQFEEDSFTRDYMNQIADWFSNPSVKSYDNLTRLQTLVFSAASVPNTSPANPAIMERQMIEFMKYRGPVNMAFGFLNKLNLLSEAPKQGQTVECKMKYEKELKSVEDACLNAKEKLADYEKELAAAPPTTKPEKLVDALKAQQREVTGRFREATKYTVAYSAFKKPQLHTPAQSTTSPTLEELERQVDSPSKAYSLLHAQINGLVGGDNRKYEGTIMTLAKLQEVDNPFDVVYDTATRYLGKYQQEKALCRDTSPGVDAQGNPRPSPKEEFEAEHEASVTAARDQKDAIDSALEKAGMAHETLKADANRCTVEGAAMLLSYQNFALGCRNTLQELDAALDKVIDQLDNAEKERLKWKDSMETLQDGDFKGSMQGEYSVSAGQLDKEKIVALKKLMEKNFTFFDSMYTEISRMQYCGKAVAGTTNANGILVQAKKSTPPTWTTNDKAVDAIQQTANTLMSSFPVLDTSRILPARPNADYIMLINTEKELPTEPDQAFILYLRKLPDPNKAIAENKEAKKQAEKLKEDLLKEGDQAAEGDKETGGEAGDGAGEAGGGAGGAGGGSATPEADATVDAERLAAIMMPPKDSTPVDGGGRKPTTVELKNDNDSVTNAMGNLGGGFPDLGKLAEAGRDCIYVEEYLTEMFSYATIDKADGKNTTITGVTIDPTNNKYYLGEVEFLLWGNDAIKSNVSATKAGIFGIRMLMNVSYAFTSPEIQNMAFNAAVAIAGWTGFGIPIVQSVVTIALAAAESSCDLTALMEGKSVAVAKSSKTWVLSPSNAAKGLVSMGKDMVVSMVEQSVSHCFELLNEGTEEAFQKITGPGGALQTFVGNTTAQITDAAVGMVTATITRLVTTVSQSMEYNEASARQLYLDAMQGLEATASQGEPCVDQKVRLAILQMAQEDTVTNMVMQLMGQCHQATMDGAKAKTTELTQMIENCITNVTTTLRDKANSLIGEVGAKLQEKVTTILASGEADVQQKVSDAMGEWTGELGGTAATVVGEDGKKTVTSGGGGFTMNYQEYLKIFVLMATMADGWKGAMLGRAAYLMEANLQHRSETGFDILKSATMVSVSARVQVDTAFLDLDLTRRMNESGKEQYDLDYKSIGKGEHAITYFGVYGY